MLACVPRADEALLWLVPPRPGLLPVDRNWPMTSSLDESCDWLAYVGGPRNVKTVALSVKRPGALGVENCVSAKATRRSNR